MPDIFEDDFTGGVKPEWVTVVGTWQHHSELNAYQAVENVKNQTKVDIVTPDDMLVECKMIGIPAIQNVYFDLLSRHSWSNGYNSGYSISYMEVYSRLYEVALFLIRWENGVRKGYLDETSWAELGLAGIADLEGKTIGIKCEGDVIKGYLDGAEILTATDAVYTTGQAGLLAQPSTGAFIFDDFGIATLLAPPPSGKIVENGVMKKIVDGGVLAKIIEGGA